MIIIYIEYCIEIVWDIDVHNSYLAFTMPYARLTSAYISRSGLSPLKLSCIQCLRL